MSNSRLAALGLGAAVVGANAYWWRRERTVREALAVSREWDTTSTSSDRPTEPPEAAKEIADALGVELPNAPEKAGALVEERRELEQRLDTVRDQWVETWFDARTTTAVDTDGPHVLVISLPGGVHADAQAFARHAVTNDYGITIVTAHADGTFAVAVGSEATPFAADAVAREFAGMVGGSAGGNEGLASGGGASDNIDEKSRELKERLENTEEFNELQQNFPRSETQ